MTPYLPFSSAGWSARIDLEVGVEIGQLPLALERLEQPGQVAGRRRELRRRDLDVVEPDDRVDDEVADVEALAHDLAVDLALGRDVDEDVAADLRPCTTDAGPPPRPFSSR